MATISCVPSVNDGVSVATPLLETGAVPRFVGPSTNVTVPAFTVRPEVSVTDRLAVRVTLAVVPEVMEAGLGDPLTVIAVGCAFACMVKFRHQEPIDPSGGVSVNRSSAYKLQVLFAPWPANAVVNEPEPVGGALVNVDGAGDGNVSRKLEPISTQSSVGRQLVQGGAVS